MSYPPNVPAEMDISKVLTVCSAKGGDMLCVDDYLYHFEKLGKQNTFRWLCNRRKEINNPCKSRLITELDPSTGLTEQRVISGNYNHSHARCSSHEIRKVRDRKQLGPKLSSPLKLFQERRKQMKLANELNEDESFVTLLTRNDGRRMAYNRGHLYYVYSYCAHRQLFEWHCVRKVDLQCVAAIRTKATITGEHRVQARHTQEHAHPHYTMRALHSIMQRNDIKLFDVEDIAELLGEAELPPLDAITDCHFNDVFPEAHRQQLSKPKKLTSDELAAIINRHIPPPNYDPLTETRPNRFSFLPSAKGHKVLCLQRHVYHLESIRSEYPIMLTWSCIYRRNKDVKCGVHATLALHGRCLKYTRSSRHNHPPPLHDIRVRLGLVKTKGAKATAKYSKVSQDNPEEWLESYGATTDDAADQCEGGKQLATSTSPQRVSVLYTDNGMEGINAEIRFTNVQKAEPTTPSKSVDNARKRTSRMRVVNLSASELGMNLNNISKLRSAKGRELLCVDNYIFYTKNGSAGAREYWVCIKSRDPKIGCKCRMSISTQDDGSVRILRVFNQHSHAVSLDDIKRRLYNEIKRQSQNNIKFKPGRFSEMSLEEIYNEFGDLVIDRLRVAPSKPVMLRDTTLSPPPLPLSSPRASEDANLCFVVMDSEGEVADSTVSPASAPSVPATIQTTTPNNMENDYIIEYMDSDDLIEVLSSNESTAPSIEYVTVQYPQAQKLIEYSAEMEQSMCAETLYEQGADDAHTIFIDNGDTMFEGAQDNLSLSMATGSVPGIAVRMLLHSLGLHYKPSIIDVQVFSRSQDSWLKFNAHQTETLVLYDNDFRLSECIAIMQYLCDKYESPLYPKSFTQRALVNQRLSFCMTCYHVPIAEICLNLMCSPGNTLLQHTALAVQNALDTLESHLQQSKTKYCATDELTIADFALASVTMLIDVAKIDISNCARLTEWYSTFKSLNPQHYDIGIKAIDIMLADIIYTIRTGAE